MMKIKLTIAWNIAIALFIALVTDTIAPKVAEPFQSLDKIPEGAFRWNVMMVGFEAIGLIVVVIAGAFSLSSVFWKKVDWGWRAVFLAVFLAAVIGTFIAIEIDKADMGLVYYFDYILFLTGTIVIVFPIVIFGRGYPNLIMRMYHRIKKPIQGEDGGAKEAVGSN